MPVEVRQANILMLSADLDLGFTTVGLDTDQMSMDWLVAAQIRLLVEDWTARLRYGITGYYFEDGSPPHFFQFDVELGIPLVFFRGTRVQGNALDLRTDLTTRVPDSHGLSVVTGLRGFHDEETVRLGVGAGVRYGWHTSAVVRPNIPETYLLHNEAWVQARAVYYPVEEVGFDLEAGYTFTFGRRYVGFTLAAYVEYVPPLREQGDESSQIQGFGSVTWIGFRLGFHGALPLPARPRHVDPPPRPTVSESAPPPAPRAELTVVNEAPLSLHVFVDGRAQGVVSPRGSRTFSLAPGRHIATATFSEDPTDDPVTTTRILAAGTRAVWIPWRRGITEDDLPEDSPLPPADVEAEAPTDEAAPPPAAAPPVLATLVMQNDYPVTQYVFIDGELVGTVPTGTSRAFRLEPGVHRVTSSDSEDPDDNPVSATMELSAGEERHWRVYSGS